MIVRMLPWRLVATAASAADAAASMSPRIAEGRSWVSLRRFRKS